MENNEFDVSYFIDNLRDENGNIKNKLALKMNKPKFTIIGTNQKIDSETGEPYYPILFESDLTPYVAQGLAKEFDITYKAMLGINQKKSIKIKDIPEVFTNYKEWNITYPLSLILIILFLVLIIIQTVK